LTIAQAAVPPETELLLLILMLLVVVLVLPSLSLLVYLGRRGPGRLARCGNRLGEGLPLLKHGRRVTVFEVLGL
jgi:hypothetical protein